MANNVIAKLGKGLIKTSAEELANLTGTPAPSDAASAAALGAPAKSQDMMGTPANVRNAIKVNLSDTQVKESLATRERQGRVQETKEEDRGAAEATLATATSLFGRVGAAIQNQISKAGQEKVAIAIKPDVEQGIMEGIAPETITTAREELAKVASAVSGQVAEGVTETDANVAFRKSVAKLNRMGITGEQIREALGLDLNAWTDKLLDTIPDDIRMGDLDISSTDGNLASQVGQLKGALNLKDDDFHKLTWTEFKQKVRDKQKEEFADVAGLRAMASDPLTSPSLKQEANRRLRELGQAGVYGEFEEAEKLAEAVEKADTVTINGQNFSMEEILDDEVAADLIKQNLDTPDKLKGTAFESLIPLITGHRTALYTRLADVNKAQQIIDTNLKALPTYKQFGDTQIPDALAQVLHPDLLNEDVQLGVRLPAADKAAPLYRSLMELSKNPETVGQVKTMVGEMTGLAAQEKDKPVLEWLSKKDANWLTNSGFLANPTQKLQGLKSNLSVYEAAKNTKDDLSNTLGAGGAGYYDTLTALGKSDLESLQRTMAAGNKLAPLLDANQDGVIDDSSSIEKRILEMMTDAKGNVDYDKVMAYNPNNILSNINIFADAAKNMQTTLNTTTAGYTANTARRGEVLNTSSTLPSKLASSMAGIKEGVYKTFIADLANALNPFIHGGKKLSEMNTSAYTTNALQPWLDNTKQTLQDAETQLKALQTQLPNLRTEQQKAAKSEIETLQRNINTLNEVLSQLSPGGSVFKEVEQSIIAERAKQQEIEDRKARKPTEPGWKWDDKTNSWTKVKKPDNTAFTGYKWDGTNWVAVGKPQDRSYGRGYKWDEETQNWIDLPSNASQEDVDKWISSSNYFQGQYDTYFNNPDLSSFEKSSAVLKNLQSLIADLDKNFKQGSVHISDYERLMPQLKKKLGEVTAKNQTNSEYVITPEQQAAAGKTPPPGTAPGVSQAPTEIDYQAPVPTKDEAKKSNVEYWTGVVNDLKANKDPTKAANVLKSIHKTIQDLKDEAGVDNSALIKQYEELRMKLALGGGTRLTLTPKQTLTKPTDEQATSMTNTINTASSSYIKNLGLPTNTSGTVDVIKLYSDSRAKKTPEAKVNYAIGSAISKLEGLADGLKAGVKLGTGEQFLKDIKNILNTGEATTPAQQSIINDIITKVQSIFPNAAPAGPTVTVKTSSGMKMNIPESEANKTVTVERKMGLTTQRVKMSYRQALEGGYKIVG